MIAILFGLVSAVTWGAADFAGGVAAKRTSAYGVVIAAHTLSLLLMLSAAALFGERVPPLHDWLWGVAAGVASGSGLMTFYRALAGGRMSLAAPVAALVGAAVPVLVGMATEGLPGWFALAGFLLALPAIWLTSQTASARIQADDLRLPVLAGVLFGIFFVALHQASSRAVLWPVVATRIGSTTSLVFFASLARQPWKPARTARFPIVMSSVLDTIGTVCFALAGQLGRLDVASILGALYPGATVALAWLLLKERITRLQWVGILLALLAILLITL